MERRQRTPRLCLHLARSQAGVVPRSRRLHRRRSRGDGRDRTEVLRERQRQGQLEVPAQVQGDPLVQRARWLGPDVPLRPHHRQAEESDHPRRRKRHAGAVRGRRHPHDLLSGGWQGEGARPLLLPLLQHPLRRKRPDAADARGCGPRRNQFVRRPLLRRRLLNPDTAADRGSSRQQRQGGHGGWQAGHHETRRRRLGSAHSDHRQGARRQDRPLRLPVQAHRLRRVEEVPHREQRLPRPADRLMRSPQLHGGASRHAVAGGAWLHRRLHRRHGNALALQGLPRGLLRQPRRQHHPRPGLRHEGPRRKVPMDRSQSRRHVRTLRRRQRHGCSDVQLPRLLQGGHRRERQPRSARL